MENLILFVNSFLSYAFVFVIVAALMVAAGFIGVTLRKRKNAQQAIESKEGGKL